MLHEMFARSSHQPFMPPNSHRRKLSPAVAKDSQGEAKLGAGLQAVWLQHLSSQRLPSNQQRFLLSELPSSLL